MKIGEGTAKKEEKREKKKTGENEEKGKGINEQKRGNKTGMEMLGVGGKTADLVKGGSPPFKIPLKIR